MEIKAFDKIPKFSGGTNYMVWANEVQCIIKLSHPKVTDQLLKSIENNPDIITEGSLSYVQGYEQQHLSEICNDMFTPLQYVLEGEPHTMLVSTACAPAIGGR